MKFVEQQCLFEVHDRGKGINVLFKMNHRIAFHSLLLVKIDGIRRALQT